MSSVGFPIFVVTALLAGTAAAIVLTPKDILRSAVVERTAPTYVADRAGAMGTADSALEFFPVETAVPAVQFASLTVSVTPLAEPVAVVDATPALVMGKDIRRITAGSLNMRSEPNKFSDLVASLPRGTEVSVSDTSGTWAYVTTSDGTSGWLSQNFLSPAN